MEIVTDFIFLGSRITPAGDCSHEMKRCLVFGRKAMTNLESILKSRVKAMVFPIVMCVCENWTIKKLSTEELVLLHCGVGEDSLVSLGLEGD